MTGDTFTDLILSIQIWSIAKLMVVVFLGVYIGFAFVVVKQVGLMTETLHALEGVLKAVATLHLVLAILVFLMAILIL